MRIEEYLEGREYPGRILVGGTLSNGKPFAVYAITARSDRSRNRVIKSEGGAVYTELYDKSGEDDSLLIYSLRKENGKCRILANGSHSENVFSVCDGKSLFDAMEGLSYEPDSLSTPRITLMEDLESGEYELGIVRNADGKSQRMSWKYQNTPGFGHIISTYEGTPEEPCAFSSDPETVEIGHSASEFIKKLYGSLSSRYRVALYACYGDAERIINERG